MTRIARARAKLWPLIVVLAAIALVFAAFRMAATTAALAAQPTPSDPPQASIGSEGVVCFGTVDLQLGVTSLGPLQPGRVAEVVVVENQHVAPDAELLRLEDTMARTKLAEAEAGVELARSQLDHARKEPVLHRIRIAQQQAMLQAMASRSAAARDARSHQEKLAKSVVVPESDKSITSEKVREMEALERAEQERLAELEAQDVDDAIRRAEYELKAAIARREAARLTLEDCRVRAPRAGTVLRILVGPGDLLGSQPGQTGVLFAADGPQVIRATVEQEFARRIKKGAPALVHDEADASATWRGRVERLASWYSQRRPVLHDPSQLSDVRTLECVIVLEPGQPTLRLGQSVRVSIGPVP